MKAETDADATKDKLDNAAQNVLAVLFNPDNLKEGYGLVARGLTLLARMELSFKSPGEVPYFSPLEKFIKRICEPKFFDVTAHLNKSRRDAFPELLMASIEDPQLESEARTILEASASWLLSVEELLLAQWALRRHVGDSWGNEIESVIVADMNKLKMVVRRYPHIGGYMPAQYVHPELQSCNPLLGAIYSCFETVSLRNDATNSAMVTPEAAVSSVFD